jgi:hypothetical protein
MTSLSCGSRLTGNAKNPRVPQAFCLVPGGNVHGKVNLVAVGRVVKTQRRAAGANYFLTARSFHIRRIVGRIPGLARSESKAVKLSRPREPRGFMWDGPLDFLRDAVNIPSVNFAPVELSASLIPCQCRVQLWHVLHESIFAPYAARWRRAF